MTRPASHGNPPARPRPRARTEPAGQDAGPGAATGLWAATAPELVDRGGVSCEDCSIKGVVPPGHADMATGGVKQWAIDADSAERLNALSVAATGLDPKIG